MFWYRLPNAFELDEREIFILHSMLPTYKAEIEEVLRLSTVNRSPDSFRRFIHALTLDPELADRVTAERLLEESLPKGTRPYEI